MRVVLCLAAGGFVTAPIAVLFLSVDSPAPESTYFTSGIERLVRSAVLVKTTNGSGSGTLIRKGSECYVLTAGHVVEDTPPPYEVVYPLVWDGITVDRAVYQADLVAYSGPDGPADDVAVLRVRYGGLGTNAQPFRLAKSAPVGSPLQHVGCFLGWMGANSYSTGVMSFIGRSLDGVSFDQTSAPIYSGSSGGGVYNDRGEYVGMIVRSVDPTFNLIVPARRLQSWADAHGFSWLFNGDPAPDNLPIVSLTVTRAEAVTPASETENTESAEGVYPAH